MRKFTFSALRGHGIILFVRLEDKAPLESDPSIGSGEQAGQGAEKWAKEGRTESFEKGNPHRTAPPLLMGQTDSSSRLRGGCWI
jgi:hypothetical protein